MHISVWSKCSTLTSHHKFIIFDNWKCHWFHESWYVSVEPLKSLWVFYLSSKRSEILQIFETHIHMNRNEAVGDRKGWVPKFPNLYHPKYSTIDRYRLNLNKIKCNNGKINWNTTVEFGWDRIPDQRIIEYMFVSEKKKTRILLYGRAHQIGKTDKIIENIHFQNNEIIESKNRSRIFQISKIQVRFSWRSA